MALDPKNDVRLATFLAGLADEQIAECLIACDETYAMPHVTNSTIAYVREVERVMRDEQQARADARGV